MKQTPPNGNNDRHTGLPAPSLTAPGNQRARGTVQREDGPTDSRRTTASPQNITFGNGRSHPACDAQMLPAVFSNWSGRRGRPAAPGTPDDRQPNVGAHPPQARAGTSSSQTTRAEPHQLGKKRTVHATLEDVGLHQHIAVLGAEVRGALQHLLDVILLAGARGSIHHGCDRMARGHVTHSHREEGSWSRCADTQRGKRSAARRAPTRRQDPTEGSRRRSRRGNVLNTLRQVTYYCRDPSIQTTVLKE